MVELRAHSRLTVGAIQVTPAQVAAAKLRVEMADESGEEVDEAVRAIAGAGTASRPVNGSVSQQQQEEGDLFRAYSRSQASALEPGDENVSTQEPD